jgi:hypothetical protein
VASSATLSSPVPYVARVERLLNRPRPSVRDKLLGQRGPWVLAPIYLIVFLSGVVWDLFGGDSNMKPLPAIGFALLAILIISIWFRRPVRGKSKDL